MAKFLLMRHAEPDYTEIDKRKYRAFGNDLASLSQKGIEQATAVSMDERLKDVDLILTSPFTRTLHTASIISKELDVKLVVELDLMEWIPDKAYMYDDYSKVVKWREKYDTNNGKHSSDSDNWEEKFEIVKRVNNVLKKYQDYSCVLVITHGMVINALTDTKKPENVQIVEYNLEN